jgi:hypothetical protein
MRIASADFFGGSNMSGALRVIIAIGLMCSSAARAQEFGPDRDASSHSVELCQAFAWDEPIEQTFTVASVLRWRHGVRIAGGQQVEVQRAATVQGKR